MNRSWMNVLGVGMGLAMGIVATVLWCPVVLAEGSAAADDVRMEGGAPVFIARATPPADVTKDQAATTPPAPVAKAASTSAAPAAKKAEKPPDADAKPSDVVKSEVATSVATATPPVLPEDIAAEDAAAEAPDAPSGKPVEMAHVLSAPLDRRELSGVPINSEGQDIEQATFAPEVINPPLSTFDPRDAAGAFRWATGYEKTPIPLYVQYNECTLVEFANGERLGEVTFCGDCAAVTPETGQVQGTGRFLVMDADNRICIKGRRPSTHREGVVATNLHIVTDRNRTITFNLIEVSGTGLQRTDRLEIRDDASSSVPIVAPTFRKQVERAAGEIRAEYQKSIEEMERSVLGAKASRRLESYSDFEVDRKSRKGRQIELESVTTIGDQTVIKMVVGPLQAREAADGFAGDFGDPMALLQKDKRLQPLETRSIDQKAILVKDEPYVVITMTIEGIVLMPDERLVVTMIDKKYSGKELRSSAGTES